MIGLIIITKLFLSLFVHDIHVSNTEVFITENGQIEITIKTFFDDLQTSLGLTPGEELPDDFESSEVLITKFIENNLFVHVNNKVIPLELENTTHSNPAVWIDVKSPINLKEGDLIQVYNHIMIDLFSDQQNIVKFESKTSNKLEMLNSKKTLASFRFDE